MAKAMTVKAEPRAAGGTSVARRLRRSGVLPGVVYGEGKTGVNIQFNSHEFTKSLGHHAGEHQIMDLEIAGQGSKKVLLQEIQHHPITGAIIHVDFHEVSMTKKLRLEVSIRLVGEPHGVTQQGGVLEHLLRQIQVECLPADIPEHIDVDVSALSIGDSLKVGDIKTDEAKVKILSSKDLPIAAVSAPREEEVAATPDAAAAAATAEPEVLREKKPEEGEAAEGAAKDAKAGGKDAKPAAGAKEGAPAKDAKAGAKEAKK